MKTDSFTCYREMSANNFDSVHIWRNRWFCLHTVHQHDSFDCLATERERDIFNCRKDWGNSAGKTGYPVVLEANAPLTRSDGIRRFEIRRQCCSSSGSIVKLVGSTVDLDQYRIPSCPSLSALIWGRPRLRAWRSISDATNCLRGERRLAMPMTHRMPIVCEDVRSGMPEKLADTALTV